MNFEAYKNHLGMKISSSTDLKISVPSDKNISGGGGGGGEVIS